MPGFISTASSARAFVAMISLSAAFMLATVTASRAGPCTQGIAVLQARVDSALEATAATAPLQPESRAALLHHQPTPASIAHAELEGGDAPAGERAMAALARAREADDAGAADLCRSALAAARRALMR
jgi:hypothetical protein